jgi:integrase
MLTMLIGCGLRRDELLALRVDSIQMREEHWVIADLFGKASHIHTAPVPGWVKAAVDESKDARTRSTIGLASSPTMPGDQ